MYSYIYITIFYSLEKNLETRQKLKKNMDEISSTERLSVVLHCNIFEKDWTLGSREFHSNNF
jgi:aminoglycoside N3'-acetyltransferase